MEGPRGAKSVAPKRPYRRKPWRKPSSYAVPKKALADLPLSPPRTQQAVSWRPKPNKVEGVFKAEASDFCRLWHCLTFWMRYVNSFHPIRKDL